MEPVGMGVLNPVLPAVFGTAPLVHVTNAEGVLPKWQLAQSGLAAAARVVGIWVLKLLKTTLFVMPKKVVPPAWQAWQFEVIPLWLYLVVAKV